ncbi:MAG: mannose-1-phosphate guanylyltransferase/mannose-6-phosphate isomerase, partial [Oceanicoccus sp.]
MLIPVLLSGGVGSRLWPLSRELNPKQFLPLTGELSLLEQTLQRALNLQSGKPIIVCNDDHRFMVAEQLRNVAIEPDAIILEPVGRNTAPAVAVAAMRAVSQAEDAVLLVMPADHVVNDIAAFTTAVETGLAQAEQGNLVTFGIIPEGPETGYGYIRRSDVESAGCFSIAEFVEKPSLEVAQQYVDSGDYYWNSGMFLLGAKAYLDELRVYAPDMLAAVELAYNKAHEDLDFIRLDAEEFAACDSDSIDYAVMEKTDKGMVVPMACGWSDVGAWSSLWDVGDKDSRGNVSSGDTILHNTEDS